MMSIHFNDIVDVGKEFVIQDLDRESAVANCIAKLFDGDELIEEYELSLRIPDNHLLFPLVSERSQKIPTIPDRHVNPDGSFCLGVYARQIILIKDGMNFQGFINQVLLPFLANQTLINKGVRDTFLLGEMPHFESGIRSYYYDFLNTKNHKIITKFIKLALRPKIPKKKNCPCKSGKSIKNCHFLQLKELSKIGNEQLSKDLNALAV